MGTPRTVDLLSSVALIERAKAAMLGHTCTTLCEKHKAEGYEGVCCHAGDAHLLAPGGDQQAEHTVRAMLTEVYDVVATEAEGPAMVAMLHTSQNRGDHAADVVHALPVERHDTVAHLLDVAAEAGGSVQYGAAGWMGKVLDSADVVTMHLVAHPTPPAL